MDDLLHILAIDDDPTSSFLLKQFVELHTPRPLRFDVAVSVDEALDQLQHLHDQQQFPQLIFVDIRLPLKNGFAFIEAYEQLYFSQYPTSKVYMLSSSSLTSDRRQSEQYSSVKGFIQKSDLDERLGDIL